MTPMEMGYELGLRQVQKLVMTPRLQQALRLLQMPLAQLEQVIEEEVTANPVLETTPEESSSSEPRENPEKVDSSDQLPAEKTESPSDTVQKEIDWTRLFDAQDTGGRWEREAPREEREVVIVSRTGLSEHLTEQLRLTKMTPEQISIGEYIIGSLDEDGYLRSVLPEEIANELDVSLEQVEEVRQAIMQFDPVGIASLELRESLLAQLEAKGRRETLAWSILDQHLDDLMKKRFPKLSDVLGCTVEEIQAAANEIARLDPRSGVRYSREEPRFVVPDLVVDEVDGDYVVAVNDRHLPRLRINRVYQGLLVGSKDEEVKSYIGNRLNAAKWLIRTIEQRRRTMVRVMSYIVDIQREFFDRGDSYLKPLTLQEVADGVGMHESTISRVTSGKYVQTPKGVFELKYFFSGGLKKRSGEFVSVKTIRRIIKDLVEDEDSDHPMSDEKIAGELRKKDFKIARRTVTKYREQMSILPARLRQYRMN